MALCAGCGATLAPEENFCGSCGARQSQQLATGAEAAAPPGSAHLDAVAGSTFGNIPTESDQGSDNIGSGGSTGQLLQEDSQTSSVVKESEAKPQKKSKSNALPPGKVLNSRYEIVRRIGGGGMGAVYLAKDRNLGDAPRAVKEMIQSHIDETQHEKAIADFKRESLLLTALEHPSIPTIYDYL